jgi:hypothetical protein
MHFLHQVRETGARTRVPELRRAAYAAAAQNGKNGLTGSGWPFELQDVGGIRVWDWHKTHTLI